MEQFLKSVGPLIGAIVAFLIGYIRLKERVSSVEATIKAIDKKLEEVQQKMDKRDAEMYGRITSLEVSRGAQEERTHNIMSKLNDIMQSMKEVQGLISQGK